MPDARPRHIPPLLPPAVALCVGILAARYFKFFPITMVSLCLTGCAVVLSLKSLKLSLRVSACIFLTAGFAAFYAYGPGAPSYVSEFTGKGEVRVSGVVARPAQDREGYTVVYLRPMSIPPGFRRAGSIRLTVRGTNLGIDYGDVLDCKVRLKEPSGLRNPGAFDWGAYARLNGIDAEASTRPEELYRTGNIAGPVMGRVYSFRRRLIDKAHHSLDGSAEAIFRAIILGDQGAVTMDMRDVFSASGTTHILSVSGSHIALLAGFVFFIVNAFFRLLPSGWALRLSLHVNVKKLAAAVAIPATVMYCLIAGSEVATVRSVIMVCMFLVSILFDRQNQVLNTLSAAAITVLALDPSAIFDISYRLSYLAVLFIALAIESVRDWKPFPDTGHPRADRLARRTMLATVMSAAAIAGTAPLVASQFKSFSWVALPANLALLPAAGTVAVPLGLFSCALDAVSPGTGLPLSNINAVSLDTFYRMVGLFASLPSANIHPPSPGPVISVAFYAVTITALSLRIPFARKALITAAAVVVFGASTLYHPAEGVMKVCFLDAGQGECAVVEFPDGTTMLIDCGGAPGGAGLGRRAAAPYLWDEGIGTLDCVVISHPHPDHISGLPYILSSFKAGQLWEGGLVSDGQYYTALRNIAHSMGVPRYVVPERAELALGGVTVQSLHTANSALDDEGLEQGSRINNRSLVLRLKYKDVSVLFAGDIEKRGQISMLAERPPLPLRSTVLKAPHHGGEDACVPEFIRAVSPEVTVISAGRDNRHGHPSPETVNALESAGADVFCTDRDGAVTVETDGYSLDVYTYESKTLVPAHNWHTEIDNIAKILGY